MAIFVPTRRWMRMNKWVCEQLPRYKQGGGATGFPNVNTPAAESSPPSLSLHLFPFSLPTSCPSLPANHPPHSSSAIMSIPFSLRPHALQSALIPSSPNLLSFISPPNARFPLAVLYSVSSYVRVSPMPFFDLSLTTRLTALFYICNDINFSFYILIITRTAHVDFRLSLASRNIVRAKKMLLIWITETKVLCFFQQCLSIPPPSYRK